MRRRLIGPAALALVLTPYLTGTAQAASTCTWDSGTATLTIVADDLATLVVSGQDFLVEGAASCAPAGATTATVDDIVISSTPPDGEFTIDLSGGAFAPGAGVEATGASEIEFTVSDLLVLEISATTGNDLISLGANGINLNADDDADVTVSDVSFVSVTLREGSDALNASGDAVVGTGFTGDLIASGGTGTDSLTGGPAGDTLLGDEDADVLVGGGGQDHLSGGDSSDLLTGGPGPDDLGGDRGRDTTIYADAPAAVSVNLAAGASGGAGADELDSIERVIGSGFADTIIGNDVANVLEGGGGNDLINGRGGPDELFGEAGRDRASFAGSPNRVTVNLGLDSATGWGNDFVQGIEDVTGSSNNDILTGSVLANRLVGGGGSDRLRGSGGADFLQGLAGKDRIVPGVGRDRASGGPGRDILDLSTADRSVTINFSTGKTGGDGADKISGFEEGVGSRFADSFVGNGSANEFRGGRGADVFRGLGGPDWMLGGAGQDRINGNDGADVLVGDADHDVLNGGAGGDRIGGGAGPDLLHGNAGNDVLNGGPGTDTCYQDAGSGLKTSCEKPAPPPSGGGGGGGGGSGSCTPGYSPCIPPGPDVDCAGGSGDGPRYTQPGVVYHVTGSDPYGLDADNDGLGCE